jgi:capsular exopolysaccharide synthesis family protein
MAIIKQTNNGNVMPQADYLRLKDLFALCLNEWKWFLLSLLFFIGLAVAYILITPPVYKRSASLLIKDESKKSQSMSTEQNPFQDMGLFAVNTNVQNELLSIQSPDIILEVIKRLHLDMNYKIDGTFHKELLYGQTLPVDVSIEDLAYNDFCSFTMTLQKDDKAVLTDFTKNDEDAGDGNPIIVSLNKATDTPIGKLKISPSPHFKQTAQPDIPIYVKRTGLLQSIENCQSKMVTELIDEKATIIDISYSDQNIQRAEEFLNTLISVYNENWVKDRNQIAVSTSLFINERLQVIENELGNVDSDISSYKSANLIPDVEAASSMYMSTANQANVQLTDLNNQLYMARYIRDHVSNKNNVNQLLPANSGINNTAIEQQITEYNTKQLQRNSLVANSSEANPLVQDMDKQLSEMRSAIVSSIDNQVNTINTQIRGMRSIQGASTSRIASNPTQAKYLLSVERQQKVKEALYLFLLQKREENELSQAFTAYNTRVVKTPFGELKPTTPDRRRILLGAILLGLLVPIVLVYIRENLNTKVRGRKDIEKLSIPFVGEIPLHVSKHHKEEEYRIVVKPKNRNVINEAFRVVRTNIELLSAKGDAPKTMMLTSVNAGSGKTFLTMNLAACFAIKGFKVVAVDMDFRRASLSRYANEPVTGLADYLDGKAESWEDVVVPIDGCENVSLIPVGTKPKDPTELLFCPKLEHLLKQLRESYDLVLLDCPPVEIVADTTIIARWADMTLFTIRAGLMERDMLPIIEGYYNDRKFHNMILLLNGTIEASSNYSSHRNSFHYGYNSGYGYGYKYGYAGYSKE